MARRNEGHVLQDYRIESRDVEELGPHALRKRALKSGRKKSEKASRTNPLLYHGERARFHFFQCQQLLFRMQVQCLLKLWHLPTEFEIVCRDIWALHLSLLPSPPSPEPYFFRHDMAGEPPRSAGGNSGGTTHTIPEEGQEAEDKEDGKSSSDLSTDSEDEYARMADLEREVSESPTSSSDEEEGETNDQAESRKKAPTTAPRPRNQRTYNTYDSPLSTIAVLMLSCWTLRIPVTYMDFIRAIESYDLVYLDPIRLLPAAMVQHLTKYTMLALSPHFSPRPMQVHTMVSRLARLLHRKHHIFIPEMNVAPVLWRTVRAFEGTPTLYNLVKKIADVLSLPLTLHHSLTPTLKRKKAKDPSWHKFDNVPVEVSLSSAVIVVLKLVYGLDGTARIPVSRVDPLYALPELNALLVKIQSLEEGSNPSMQDVLSVTSELTALDLDETLLDGYLDFCEKALLPPKGSTSEHTILKEYFPLQYSSRRSENVRPHDAPSALPAINTSLLSQDKILGQLPGKSYAVYSPTDILGTAPEDYELVMQRAAHWTGVDEEVIHGVVENLERRLARWWTVLEKQKQAQQGDDSDQ
ncbi:hypothetical protein BXZ70DRAFT_398730 [Cristinia sonorae]|uniref:Uncharacterized protein n=1 Tax=Cristinia sonorae TaxID=1940300 RepID=A0A8K0UVT6_9AGAR|nr:hypothetical protein BXZ70DRAFT_398730 [Cristinia sonorae]